MSPASTRLLALTSTGVPADYASVIVNTLLAGPLYLFRKTAMSLALKAAARKG